MRISLNLYLPAVFAVALVAVGGTLIVVAADRNAPSWVTSLGFALLWLAHMAFTEWRLSRAMERLSSQRELVAYEVARLRGI